MLAPSLLAEAGYPNGFELSIQVTEWLKLEGQVISKMLERIGLKPVLNVVTDAQFFANIMISLLDRPPEETQWDVLLFTMRDYWANPGLSFLPWHYLPESDMVGIEYDAVYEKMFREMTGSVNPLEQEEKIRQIVQYLYDNAYAIFIYSPLTLYSVNKEVNLVPYRSGYVRFKETSVTENHWSVRRKND